MTEISETIPLTSCKYKQKNQSSALVHQFFQA